MSNLTRLTDGQNFRIKAIGLLKKGVFHKPAITRGVWAVLLASLFSLSSSVTAQNWAPIVEGGRRVGAGGATSGTNQGILELLQQVERLQKEVQHLRGQIEEQGYTIDQLQKRQKDFYADLDNRVQALETGESDAAASETETASGELASSENATSEETSVAAAAPVGEAGTGPVADSPAPGPESEKAAYEQAFNLLKSGKYELAIEGFNRFLSAYPNSEYADNAQYWIGEANYVTRHFEPAIAEYSKLTQAFPDSPKLPHALLKIGYSYDELGQSAEAKAKLKDLIARYPGTTAAQLAEERLRQMSAP